jgi:hypothetical protein
VCSSTILNMKDVSSLRGSTRREEKPEQTATNHCGTSCHGRHRLFCRGCQFFPLCCRATEYRPV